MVVHASNPSSRDTEAGRSEFQDCQGCRINSVLKRSPPNSTKNKINSEFEAGLADIASSGTDRVKNRDSHLKENFIS